LPDDQVGAERAARAGPVDGMIATLSSRESSSAMARAEVSVASPGASGMTSVTGPLG